YFRLGWFNPIWTPKVLAIGFSVAGFSILWRAVPNGPAAERGLALALVLLSLQTGFVVWCVSGLENGLLALCLALLCSQTLRAVAEPGRSRNAILAGAAAGAVALTRPEGAVFALGFPVAFSVCVRESWSLKIASLAKYVATFLVVIAV